MRLIFLILLSACYIPAGNNGNGNNRRNQADTSSSSTGPDCRHVLDENDNAFFCIANDAVVYGCLQGNSCWYEAGDIHVNISDCHDQRASDTAALKLEDDCGGFYTR